MPQNSPSLLALFRCFTVIGLQSFGGGLSAWMRREVVTRRGWMAEGPFLSGLALAQIAPGANAVNLAVFLGTSLRGAPGALAALAGLMLLPVVLILGAGALYFTGQRFAVVELGLGGLGAAAIGLTLATGCNMARKGVRGRHQWVVMLAVAVSIGLLGAGLLPVLLVALPVSLWLELR